MQNKTTHSLTPARDSSPGQSIAILTTPADAVRGADAIW